MKRTRRTAAAVGISLLFGTALPVFAQPAPVNLTLREAVALTLRGNLDLKVELYNPALAEADIRRSLGIYNPLLTLGINYDRSNNQNSFNFRPIKTDQVNASAGVSQLLPTGGTVGATATSSWIGNSTSYFSDGVTLTASQPLLKNFGKEATELNINVSRLGKTGSLERFRTKLSDTVAQVRNDYFKLYNLREVLAVKRTSLALANRILDETRGRVKAGVLAAMEILNAEFGVATREKEVIDAERGVRDQMDVLRLELQLPTTAEIIPVDQPTRESYAVGEEQALALALRNRPELAAQRVTVQINDLQRRVARNRTLPDLTLNASLGAGGFDPRFTQGLVDTATAREPSWGVGLQFSYPIGNDVAQNDYIKSVLTLEQSQAQLQSLQAGIGNDVKAAIRLLASSYKQLEVTARGRAYAEERLRAFRKRNAVGLATTKDVFDVENDLVTVQGNEILALTDYNNAITQLWRVTGEILERQGITVTKRQADPLYERAK